jgi:predicted nucleic acid-binding protein
LGGTSRASTSGDDGGFGMGAGEEVAVVDAGPLIHLAEIKAWHALTVFSRLHLPHAVWAETVEQGRISAESLAYFQISQHTVVPLAVTQFSQAHDLTALHLGEQECLFLCQQLNVSLLLTDDLAARDAAKHLSLNPVGSLGVVVRAYRQALISLVDAEHFLSELYSVSSLFVTRNIVEIAIQQLRASRD